jgi:hypothetical protein
MVAQYPNTDSRKRTELHDRYLAFFASLDEHEWNLFLISCMPDSFQMGVDSKGDRGLLFFPFGRASMTSHPLSSTPIPFSFPPNPTWMMSYDVKTEIEKPVSTDKYAQSKYWSMDCVVTLFQSVNDFSGEKVSINRCVQCVIEMKTEIQSMSEVMAQVQRYKAHYQKGQDNIFYVIAVPHMKAYERLAFRRQGFHCFSDKQWDSIWFQPKLKEFGLI